MNSSYWFGLHIGDGKCVAVNPAGEFKQPIPWDPKCFLNATTSICDSDARDRCRHFYSEKLPAAVFVGSDGIDDCFKNNEQLHNLYKTVLYSFATTDFDEAYEGLKDYLPRLSSKGSGDDVSIAAILDLDLIPELSIVKEFDREKEKARVEENARKEAERNEAEKRRVEEEHARFQRQNNAKAKMLQNSKGYTICNVCGEKNKLGAKFCSDCGTKLIDIVKVSPFLSEPESEQKATDETVDENVKISTTDTSEQEITLSIKQEESEAIVETTIDFPNSSVDTPEISEEVSAETNEPIDEKCQLEGDEVVPNDESEDLVLRETESEEEVETDNNDGRNSEEENQG